MFTVIFSDNKRETARTASAMIKKINAHVVTSGAVVSSLRCSRYGIVSFFELHQIARIEVKERAKEKRELASFT